MISQDAINWVLKNAFLEIDESITLKEEPSRETWFSVLLPNLDYEIDGGTQEEPLWAWQEHPWFKALNLTDNECYEWFDNLEG